MDALFRAVPPSEESSATLEFTAARCGRPECRLCLNPKAIVAFTAVPDAFDPAVFHSLEVSARGPSLQIRLDGKLLTFDQAGRMVTSVAIPATWEGPPATGKNGGSAGIAFGALDNRWKIGGQRAKNVEVSSIR